MFWRHLLLFLFTHCLLVFAGLAVAAGGLDLRNDPSLDYRIEQYVKPPDLEERLIRRQPGQEPKAMKKKNEDTPGEKPRPE
jgi:hypothetical protein